MPLQMRRLLYLYGKDILGSDQFHQAFGQTHHKCMTVADHSLGVCVICLYICLILKKIHISVHVRDLTVAALCHDLGIMGRYEKYRNNIECCGRHPVDSLDCIRDLIGEGEYNDIIENSVRRHMWPLTPIPPRYREGVILTTADKVSAVMERMGLSPARKLDREHIMCLCPSSESAAEVSAEDLPA